MRVSQFVTSITRLIEISKKREKTKSRKSSHDREWDDEACDTTIVNTDREKQVGDD